MNGFDLHLDNFMLYCDSKHLSKKTLGSYEQTPKIFGAYLETEFEITDVEKVKSVHVRSYIKYLRERGKYTVVVDQKSKSIKILMVGQIRVNKLVIPLLRII